MVKSGKHALSYIAVYILYCVLHLCYMMGVKEMDTRIIIPVMPRNMFFQNYSCRVVILSLVKRKMLLASFTARAHWWLMFNMMPIRTPSSPAKLLSSGVAPSVCWCQGLFLPSFRNSLYWAS